MAMNSKAMVLMVGATLTTALIGRVQPIDAQPLTTSFEERLSYTFEQIDKSNMPVIVGIARQGGEIELREFGALAKDGIPPASTQITIGSITKTVTAVIAAKLVEQGKVQFDETLAEIFSNVPADKANITLHQLLTHTSGLRGAVGSDGEKLTKDAFLARLFDTGLEWEPGETYQYSNAGFGVVAAIIEERSGKPYEQYLQEDAIAGLGLENTGYMSVYGRSSSMQSKDGGDVMDVVWGGHQPYWNLIGNGGMISTVPEMIEFRRAVISGEIISAESLDLIQTPHVPEGDEGSSYYGYGLFVQDIEGFGRCHLHGGYNGVFSSQWADCQGDIIFIAGLDTKDGNAFDAMSEFRTYFHGYAADER